MKRKLIITILALGFFLTSNTRVNAQAVIQESFEGDINSWSVSKIVSGGSIDKNNNIEFAGSFSAHTTTSTSGQNAYLKGTINDPTHTWEERPGTYHWQNARVYIPSSTVNKIGSNQYITIGKMWANSNEEWLLNVRQGGQLYVKGHRDFDSQAFEFKIYGTVPTDRWFELELGLHSQQGPGVKRAFAFLIDGNFYGWYRQGKMSDARYTSTAIGIVDNTVTSSIEVYVDNWGVSGTSNLPTGKDNRSIATLQESDYRNSSGVQWQIDWSTWQNDLRLDATNGLFSAGSRLQSGRNIDKMPDLTNGWGEIEIGWPSGTPDRKPDSYFGPMIGMRKEVAREQNLEIIPIGNGAGGVDLAFEAWTGDGPIIKARWPMPAASIDATSHIPEPGDIIRTVWQQSGNNIIVKASYYDASAAKWYPDVINNTFDATNVNGINFNDGFHKASSITIDSPSYSIRRYKVGALSTYPGGSGTSTPVPTPTTTPIPTNIPTPIPTATLIPTPTPTLLPTITSTPIATPFPTIIPTPVPPVIPSVTAPVGPGEIITYAIPEDTTTILVNPDIGWQDHRPDNNWYPTSVGYMRPNTVFTCNDSPDGDKRCGPLNWDVLNPSQGVFTLSDIPNFANAYELYAKNLSIGGINYSVPYGKASIRARTVRNRVTTYTQSEVYVPEWAKAAGVTSSYELDITNDGGVEPDYHKCVFLDNYENLVKEMIKISDNDPKISHVDIGTYGFYGEWYSGKSKGASWIGLYPFKDSEGYGLFTEDHPDNTTEFLNNPITPNEVKMGFLNINARARIIEMYTGTGDKNNDGIADTKTLSCMDNTGKAVSRTYSYEGFKNKPVLINKGDDQSVSMAIQKGAGLRGDCLGRISGSSGGYHGSFRKTVNRITNVAGAAPQSVLDELYVGDYPSIWQNRPVDMEFCTDVTALDQLNASYCFIKEFHISQVHNNFNSKPSGASDDAMKKLLRELGYRFTITQAQLPKTVSTGDNMTILVKMKNQGSAPAYRKIPVVLTLSNTTTNREFQLPATSIDLTRLLPANARLNNPTVQTTCTVDPAPEYVFTPSVQIPSDLPNGNYQVKLSAYNDENNNFVKEGGREANIQFANTQKDADYKYSLGQIEVSGGTGSGPAATGGFVLPVNGSTVSGSVTVQVNYTVTNILNPILGTYIYLDNNTAPIKSCFGSFECTFSLNTTSIVNGSHTLKAEADMTFGVSVFSTINLSVNNTVIPAPTPTLTPTPTPVPTIIPTGTPIPTAIITPTPTPTVISTPIPTIIPSPTAPPGPGATGGFVLPVNGSIVSGSITVQANFSVTSILNPILGSYIYLDSNTAPIKSCFGAFECNFSLDTTTVSNGVHTLKAEADMTFGDSVFNMVNINVNNVATTPNTGCTIIIPTNVEKIDGRSTTYKTLKGGDTLCLQSGSRKVLDIVNLNGAAGNPITIKNYQGLVTFNNTQDFAINMLNSKYLHLTGTGVNNIKYGILVDGNYSSGVSFSHRSSDIEIDHMDIRNTNTAGIYGKTEADCPDASDVAYDLDGDGITVGDKDDVSNRTNFVQYNTILHDIVMKNIGTEGYYIGSTGYRGRDRTCSGTTVTVYGPVLKGVKIYNNTVDTSGWDGIQVSSVEDCNVYNNTVLRDSQKLQESQATGLHNGAGQGSCNFYNNLVKDGNGNGMIIDGSSRSLVYNNLLIRPGFKNTTLPTNGVGIRIPNTSTGYILNNTIINAQKESIHFINDGKTGNRMQNNLIVQTNSAVAFTAIRANVGIGVTQSNNLNYRTLADAKFVNSNADDYKILSNSPAVNTGANLASVGVTNDLNNVSRPQGAAFDIGAYEYVTGQTQPTPTATPSPTVISTPIPLPSVTPTPIATIIPSPTQPNTIPGGIIAPTNNSQVSNTILIVADYQLPLFTVPISTTIYIGNSAIGSCVVASACQVNWDTTKYVNGPYQLKSILRTALTEQPSIITVNVSNSTGGGIPTTTEPGTITGGIVAPANNTIVTANKLTISSMYTLSGLLNSPLYTALYIGDTNSETTTSIKTCFGATSCTHDLDLTNITSGGRKITSYIQTLTSSKTDTVNITVVKGSNPVPTIITSPTAPGGTPVPTITATPPTTPPVTPTAAPTRVPPPTGDNSISFAAVPDDMIGGTSDNRNVIRKVLIDGVTRNIVGCKPAIHDRYSVIGPDGRLYRTWHPMYVPMDTNNPNGDWCAFAHEHGDKPLSIARNDVKYGMPAFGFAYVSAGRTSIPSHAGFKIFAHLAGGKTSWNTTEYSRNASNVYPDWDTQIVVYLGNPALNDTSILSDGFNELQYFTIDNTGKTTDIKLLADTGAANLKCLGKGGRVLAANSDSCRQTTINFAANIGEVWGAMIPATVINPMKLYSGTLGSGQFVSSSATICGTKSLAICTTKLPFGNPNIPASGYMGTQREIENAQYTWNNASGPDFVCTDVYGSILASTACSDATVKNRIVQRISKTTTNDLVCPVAKNNWIREAVDATLWSKMYPSDFIPQGFPLGN